MARSTGLILAVGGISAGNEWLHHGTSKGGSWLPPPVVFRIAIGTAGAAVILAGIEKVPAGEPFAVGIAAIALITVLFASVTPGVPSPANQILGFINSGGKKK